MAHGHMFMSERAIVQLIAHLVFRLAHAWVSATCAFACLPTGRPACLHACLTYGPAAAYSHTRCALRSYSRVHTEPPRKFARVHTRRNAHVRFLRVWRALLARTSACTMRSCTGAAREFTCTYVAMYAYVHT
jgi:hypothetical protein